MKKNNIINKITMNFPINATNKTYQKLENMMENKTFDSTTIVSIIIELMQFVENYKDLSGKEKKDLVLYVLDLFIIDNMTEEEANKIKLFIQATLPSLIDTIVSIDKKELQIKASRSFKKILSCCK